MQGKLHKHRLGVSLCVCLKESAAGRKVLDLSGTGEQKRQALLEPRGNQTAGD